MTAQSLPSGGNRLLLGVVGTSVLLMLGLGVYLPWLLLSTPSTGANDAKLTAAVIAGVGCVATAVVTLAGAVLKHAIDTHTLRLQEIAQQRNEIDSDHNHQRLRLDTAISAVDLIGRGEGVTQATTRSAGALYALAALGQLDFALALLEPMWSKGEIDRDSAVWLIRKGLDANKENLQITAVGIVYFKHEQFAAPDRFYWPGSADLVWHPERCLYVRERLLEMSVKILLALPYSQWSRDALRAGIALVYSAFTRDDHPRIRGSAARFLDVLLSSPVAHRVLFTPEGTLKVAEMRARVSATLSELEAAHPVEGVSETVLKLVRDLRSWKKGAAPMSIDLGAAGTFAEPPHSGEAGVARESEADRVGAETESVPT